MRKKRKTKTVTEVGIGSNTHRIKNHPDVLTKLIEKKKKERNFLKRKWELVRDEVTRLENLE